AVLQAGRDAWEERVTVLELASGPSHPPSRLMNHHAIDWEVRQLHRPVVNFIREFRRWIDVHCVWRGNSLPSFGHAIGDTGVLVAGKSKADEPLAIELPPCLLQQRHPPPVVLDQVVVGGENLANAALIPDVPRNADFTLLDAPR